MNSRIYILSAPIQTGKTTSLRHWLKTQNNVLGILTPDIADKRMIFDISNKHCFPLECTADEKEAIKIGRFSFAANAFEQARQILQNACAAQPNWLVVDEIGKLELEQNIGLAPDITQIIKYYQKHDDKGKLLLIIRDYLLDQAIANYKLQGAVIIQDITQL